MTCYLITRQPPHTKTEIHVCDSNEHGRPDERPLATTRLHLATGPAEYCETCAAWAAKVYEVLGAHAHAEPIPLPPGASTRHDREISL